MSGQAGICNFEDEPVNELWLEKLGASIECRGRDSSGKYVNGRIGMLYRGFHTTRESRLETQPYRMDNGIAITWDGRLDNRRDLMQQVWGELRDDEPDVAIVAGAYEKWGCECFGKL